MKSDFDEIPINVQASRDTCAVCMHGDTYSTYKKKYKWDNEWKAKKMRLS